MSGKGGKIVGAVSSAVLTAGVMVGTRLLEGVVEEICKDMNKKVQTEIC